MSTPSPRTPEIGSATPRGISEALPVASELPPHNEACDIAHVPSFWAQRRPNQNTVLPIRVVSNDCLLATSGELLVVSESEISLLNVLMQQENRWATTGEIRNLIGRNEDHPSPDILERTINDLIPQGIIERRESDRPSRLASTLLESPRVRPGFDEPEWRLNPTLVIEDKRNEMWRQGIEYPIPVALTIADAQNRLREYGYALVSDWALIGPALTDELATIFDSGLVVRVPGDHPADRERARDVLNARYLDHGVEVTELEKATGKAFSEYDVYLKEASDTRIVSRACSNISERPQYSRVLALQWEAHSRYLAALLALVPPENRRIHAEVGVNYLRTRTLVTEGTHTDFGPDEDGWIAIRVNSRVGNGARTQLISGREDSGVAQEAWLRPGVSVELLPGGATLIFRDSWFRHRVTALVKNADSKALREATVTTITWPAAA